MGGQLPYPGEISISLIRLVNPRDKRDWMWSPMILAEEVHPLTNA
jgi:hypothetical protein